METGNNTTFLLSDKELEAQGTSSCHLSLLVDSDHFQWALTSVAESKVLEVGQTSSHPDELKTFLNDWALPSADLSSISLAHRGTAHTLVPNGLFDAAKANAILSLTAGRKDHPAHHTQLATPGAVLVYRRFEEREALLRNAFPSLQSHSNTALNIGEVMKRNRFDRPVQIYADLSASFLDVIVAGHKQLLLSNTFAIESDQDALFMLANAMETLTLQPDDTTLYLSGEVELSGERFKLFQSYFPKLQMNFGFEMPKVGLGLANLRKQTFMSLLNQYRCVS